MIIIIPVIAIVLLTHFILLYIFSKNTEFERLHGIEFDIKDKNKYMSNSRSEGKIDLDYKHTCWEIENKLECFWIITALISVLIYGIIGFAIKNT